MCIRHGTRGPVTIDGGNPVRNELAVNLAGSLTGSGGVSQVDSSIKIVGTIDM